MGMDFNILSVLKLLSKSQRKEFIETKRLPSNLPLQINQKLRDNYEEYKKILVKINVKDEDLYQLITLDAMKNENFKLKIRNRFLTRILGSDFELNVCQAAILDFVNLKNNVLICSPTGSGKTIMALFFILNELGYNVTDEDYENGFSDSKGSSDAMVKGPLKPRRYKENRFNRGFKNKDKTRDQKKQIKIIYLSPLKSLCMQIFSFFNHKLSEFITVRVLTSENALSSREILESNLIITTPEKFDNLLRKQNIEIDLVIIDEIHILNSERGVLLESMISRMMGQCRMLGMSATIPNLKDIARFLKAKSILFDNSFRSVPLQVNLIKPKNFREQQKDVLESLLHSLEGNSIVFIRERWAVEEYFDFFTKNTPFNCSYHHAGLSRQRRLQAEQNFLKSEDKHILFSTATLAWGINLPADNVIIIDNFMDYDIVQMMGRAGREKFFRPENIAKAFLITENMDRLDFICELKPIKSHIQDLSDIYLTNLFFRKEEKVENTLYFLERADQIFRKDYSNNKERYTDSIKNRDTKEPLPINPENGMVKEKMNYNRKLFMFNDVIDNLLAKSLIFFHGNQLVLTNMARIAVIYNIDYLTTINYYKGTRNFKTEEEIFLLLDHLEIKGFYKEQHIFPTDTTVGKYIQHVILGRKRINDTIRLIFRHLRALFHLSIEKKAARGSKLILQLILLLENNINRNYEGEESEEDDTEMQFDKEIFTCKGETSNYHLFVSDHLDDALVCYRKCKKKNLDSLSLNGVFAVCFYGNNGSKDCKIIKFQSQTKFPFSCKEPEVTDNNKRQKENICLEKLPKNTEDQNPDFFILGRKMVVIDNSIPDYCSPLLLYKHYLLEYEGAGILIFANQDDSSKFLKTSNIESYFFRDYLEQENTKEYDWCYIMGTKMEKEYFRRSVDLYPLEMLFLINSKSFYIIGHGFDYKRLSKEELEETKCGLSIKNELSLKNIDLCSEYFVKMRK